MVSALDSLSPSAQRAWRASLLAQLPERAAQVLADRARERRFQSGDVIYRGSPAGGAVSVYLIVGGLARTHVRSLTGRGVTVRYVAEGEIVGLPALIAGHSNVGVAVDVMIETTVLSLAADQFAHLAANDVKVAWTVARYLAEMIHAAEQLWSSNVFQDMHARVAFHLLELSIRDADGLVVHATQDELAGAVGSVREVVARTLKGLDDAGLIERGAGAIRLSDPAGLHRAASGAVVAGG